MRGNRNILIEFFVRSFQGNVHENWHKDDERNSEEGEEENIENFEFYPRLRLIKYINDYHITDEDKRVVTAGDKRPVVMAEKVHEEIISEDKQWSEHSHQCENEKFSVKQVVHIQAFQWIEKV